MQFNLMEFMSAVVHVYYVCGVMRMNVENSSSRSSRSKSSISSNLCSRSSVFVVHVLLLMHEKFAPHRVYAASVEWEWGVLEGWMGSWRECMLYKQCVVVRIV